MTTLPITALFLFSSPSAALAGRTKALSYIVFGAKQPTGISRGHGWSCKAVQEGGSFIVIQSTSSRKSTDTPLIWEKAGP